MELRKSTIVGGVIAIGAVAALVGQSLAAEADAPARSSKTLYANTFADFFYNVTSTASTPKTLLKVTVRAPSSGHAVVTIDSQLWTDFPSTTTTALENVITIGRCRAANTLNNTRCGGL